MYTHYAVGVPTQSLSQQEFEQLLEIIAHNEELLKKALGADNLAVVILLGRLWFPWFTPQGCFGEIGTYHALVSGLCAQAKSLDYHPMKTHQSSASKFAMWLFLLKLGFTGKHQRASRELLLKNF